MMTAEIATPAEALELLSSIYLLKPSKTAIENWKMALSEDTSFFLCEMKEAIDAINLNLDDELEELLWEYTRLFIGPYKLPCPPWESVYTSPKRLMMQDAADQVMQLYRKAGFALQNEGIMPDHIGAELNFLALLLREAYSGAEQNDRYIKLADQLLSEHLTKWLSDFTSDMESAAERTLYKALARTTRNIIGLIGGKRI